MFGLSFWTARQFPVHLLSVLTVIVDLEGNTEGQPDDPANTMVTVVGEVDMTTEQAGTVQQTGLVCTVEVVATICWLTEMIVIDSRSLNTGQK